MTETEARSIAKNLRQALIGVTADRLTPDSPWSIRAWISHKGTPELWYTSVEDMPSSWQRELSRT